MPMGNADIQIEVPMTTTRIEQDYFEWLVSQIDIRGNRTYFGMLERLHNTEFVWTVPNDDNRVQDGLDLRDEFLEGKKGGLENRGASVLEVLIGLSRRVAFTAGGEPPGWAWQLLKNLRLNKCSDPFTTQKANRVEEILEALIWRTYQINGEGGFFPLEWAKDDQTKVEIWYQMNAYVNEIQEL
jgi:hypothetical protein